MGALTVARRSLWIIAGAGVVACWVVALFFIDGAGSLWGHFLVLGLFTLASAGTMVLATSAGRPAAFACALALLLVGWLTTWMYGFMWVPGAAALVAAYLPRPRQTVSSSAPQVAN